MSGKPGITRVVKWTAVHQLGCYVGRTWRGDVITSPMNADGTRSTDRLEMAVVEPGDEHYAHLKAVVDRVDATTRTTHCDGDEKCKTHKGGMMGADPKRECRR